jgi:hypothetical protein
MINQARVEHARNPTTTYHHPLAHPCLRAASMGPRLGAWYLCGLGTHRRHHSGANGDPWRDSASPRIRKRLRPRKQGKVRPPGFLARGSARLIANRRTTTHTPTHAHHPSPRSGDFEPHSHTAFRVFWTPRRPRTTAGALVSKGVARWLPDSLTLVTGLQASLPGLRQVGDSAMYFAVGYDARPWSPPGLAPPPPGFWPPNGSHGAFACLAICIDHL